MAAPNVQTKTKKVLTFRQKCAGTLLILLACRIMSGIPAPFVSAEYFKQIAESNQALGLLNMFSGNAFSQLSIMALGITPYITASIIIQLMTVVIPKLEELRNGMKDDRDLLENITIGLGCALAFLQGLGMSVRFGATGMITPYAWYTVLLVTVIWTLGTFVEAMLGKYIEKNLIGNGISLILLANILSSYPKDAYSVYALLVSGKEIGPAILITVAVLVFIFFMFAFVVYLEGCEKKIPIVYSGKIVGNRLMTAQNSVIPIKLCPGSVVPVIFASSIFSFPALIATIAGVKGDVKWMHFLDTTYWFRSAYPWYTLGAILYVLCILGFSYYYVSIEINPAKIAENIKKNGGVIPGVRQGKPTQAYIEKQMKYMILIGGIGLSIVALVPIILAGTLNIPHVGFLGTSIIITCGVIQETMKTLSVETTQTSKYKKGAFLSHGRK